MRKCHVLVHCVVNHFLFSCDQRDKYLKWSIYNKIKLKQILINQLICLFQCEAAFLLCYNTLPHCMPLICWAYLSSELSLHLAWLGYLSAKMNEWISEWAIMMLMRMMIMMDDISSIHYIDKHIDYLLMQYRPYLRSSIT